MPYNRKAFSDDYATETFYFPLSVQVEDEDSESWTIKKAEHRRIDAFKLWCWRRLLRVP